MPGLWTFYVSFGRAKDKGWGGASDDTIIRLLQTLSTIKHVPDYIVTFHWELSMENVLKALGTASERLPFTIETREFGNQP
jgi:hypothetical protein